MSRLFVNPESASELHRLGLRAFADFFALAQGEIIGGHRTRNVARVEIGPLRGFLKREYRTPLKDYFESWWAGWGFVSKSLREARTLQALRASGIECPKVLAAGEEVGEQGKLGLVGRADECGVIIADRHVLDAAIAGLGRDGINRRDHVAAGDGEALPALHAETCDDDSHHS